MSKKQMKLNIALLIFLVGIIHVINCAPAEGEPCVGVSLCSKESGLICGPENTCVCTDGAVTSDLKYSLSWNPTLKKCFGQRGSACIGTPDNPTVEGNRTVKCAEDFICVQVKGLPIGVGSCKSSTGSKPLTHGESCNSGTFCNKAAGLICGDDNKCTCSNGPLTRDVKFIFEWNVENSKCFASIDSACVGTKQNPIVASNIVECVKDASCEETKELGLPFGVGVCKDNRVLPTTTPAPQNGEAAQSIRINTATVVFFIGLALFVVQ